MINYVIDTNVMIHDPKFMYKFGPNNLIIPIICIEELDSLKRREGIVGYHARVVAKELRNLMQYGDLSKEINLPKGGTLRVELNHMDIGNLPNGIDLSKTDSKILAITKSIQHTYPDTKTILISKDLYMNIKANALGLTIEDYPFDKVMVDKIYSGYANLSMSSEAIDEIFSGGLELPKMEEPVYPNQFFHITSTDKTNHSVLAINKGNRLVPLKYVNESAWGLKPINREQKMAFELLMDPNIHFVSITGGAGSGKTILSTAVALQNVIECNKYRKIVFVRPVVAAGNDIGYLPGEEKEKLKPWMGSFYDAIENLSDIRHQQEKYNGGKPSFTIDSFIEQFRQRGIIETKTFTYMRGRTFTNSLIIVDEAQEMTPHLAKLMLTRAGQQSKFVFIGDPSDNQIDNAFVDEQSNGLVFTVEKMKPYDITGHIALSRVERSPLAKIAERNM